MGLLNIVMNVISAIGGLAGGVAKALKGGNNKGTIANAFMDIVPYEFEGTMIGLRVKYTLDSQLYGLAQTLASYAESEIEADAEQFMRENPKGDVEEFIYSRVQEFVDSIIDKEAVCKDFWNNKGLDI